MAILTQDIKILKSAVMNDSTDGGGRMTGVPVVDGQSNSLFPDTSAMDRAFGRVQKRKVFGVAHTNDTDTLMGAHAIITEIPSDPNVHCTLMKTPNWGDQRNAAKELIERYLVKGPRMTWRIYDTHYAGSAKLRLYSFTGAQAPVSGDSVCLINPNGTELYVRILRTKSYSENVYLQEGSGTVEALTTFIECDLGQTLTMDIYGPPLARIGVNEQQYAMIYSTTLATGVKFYGTKPLGAVGSVGDFSVTTSGGIFTPLVPAATIETPVVDQYPLKQRTGLSKTGYGRWQSDQRISFSGTKTITVPTSITPQTFEMINSWGGTIACKDDGLGNLVSNGVNTGTINYPSGTVTLNFNGGFDGYYAYIPASTTGASTCTSKLEVTTVNQGLSFTENFLPPPAPTTFSIHYLAQGRWYSIRDNGIGKLSGDDSSYGSGSINYETGSVSLTLGALPDVDSSIIFEWGKLGSATQIPNDTLPTKLSCFLPMTGLISMSSIKFDLGDGNLIYKQSNGVYNVAGFDADYTNGGFIVSPHTLTNSINIQYQTYSAGISDYAVLTDENNFKLTNAPIVRGTVHFQINCVDSNRSISGGDWLNGESRSSSTYGDQRASCFDKDGKIFASCQYGQVGKFPKVIQEIGTIDYETGVISLSGKYSMKGSVTTYNVYPTGEIRVNSSERWDRFGYDNVANTVKYYRTTYSGHYSTVSSSVMSDFTPAFETLSYSGEMNDVQTATYTPNWYLDITSPLLTSGLAVNISSRMFFSRVGSLYRDWDAVIGNGVNSGTVDENGRVSVIIPETMLGTANTLSWVNAAYSKISRKVTAGIFRTSNAPLKDKSLQLAVGVSEALTNGVKFSVDYLRGVVSWYSPTPIDATELRYNTVYLEYLPLEASILGLNTARLPLDGKVPVYRSGDLCVVHNTLSLELPNPLVKGTAYAMRERLASVRVKDALGVVVPDTKYELDLNAGTITFPVGISITSYAQPFTVEHRIEDLLLCSQADISGRLRFTRSLTHDFPANTSYVSSALPFGDLYARFYNVIEQQTWTNQWSDERIGASMTANFNETDYPIVVSNRGTIKERWAVIFTGSTTFRVVGESVGEIGYGNTSDDCAPTNNATSAPYFVIPALGWGAGWSVGNVLRFNTDACGAPFWIVRTILQGPASVESDKFALAFRGDVDRP